MPRGVGVRVPSSAQMCKASDFSSRSSFFCVFAWVNSRLAYKKNEACGSLALSADKVCLWWGCGDKRYLIFKGIPASPALRSAVESLHPHFKNRAVSFDRSIFLCGYSAVIFTFPPNLPLRREACGKCSTCLINQFCLTSKRSGSISYRYSTISFCKSLY